jgi:uncharacterized protein
VVEEAIDGHLELVLAEPVMDELQRILVEKLQFEPHRQRQVEEVLLDAAAEVAATTKATPDALTGDRADDLILACAVDASVDVLVSGDRRHLLPVGEHRGVRVITPQTLLAELRRG